MLKGRSVLLRKLKLSDTTYFMRWFQDKQLMRFYDRSSLINRIGIEAWIRNNLSTGKRLDFIIETIDAKPIGHIYLSEINWKSNRCELHAMIGEKNHRNLFFGAEAECLLLLYAFRELNMHKIYGQVIEFAKESERLIKAIGFTKEVVKKKSVFLDGRYWDLLIYGLLSSEFEAFIATQKGQKYLKAFRQTPSST